MVLGAIERSSDPDAMPAISGLSRSMPTQLRIQSFGIERFADAPTHVAVARAYPGGRN